MQCGGREAQLDAVGIEQCGVLSDEGVSWFGEDAHELGLREGVQCRDDGDTA